MCFDMDNFSSIIAAIKAVHGEGATSLPLHAPLFQGREREYVLDTLESTFVSSVGAYVDRFEALLCAVTGAKHAIACVNGTSALQVALHLAGVRRGDLVITQALSFVATANAIVHAGGEPVFCDVSRETLGLSPRAVKNFLQQHCVRLPEKGGEVRHKASGRRVSACLPMHSLGLPCHIVDMRALCEEWGLALVEDAAEALGSLYHGQHCGTFGLLGVLSFNGNKICTCGGGGAILTHDAALAQQAKALTTTAKRPHAWEFYHDSVAWNFRMPNLNAALGCAQMEQIWDFVDSKRFLADRYAELFAEQTDWHFVHEPEHSRSNYWLCTVLTKTRTERDAFLAATNAAGVMTRPLWEPLHSLPMYAGCARDALSVSTDLANRAVNVPSSVQRRGS